MKGWPVRIHTRIVQHPFAQLMQGARLDAYEEDRWSLILHVHGLQRELSEVCKRGERIFERAVCRYVPLRLVFTGITGLQRSDFFSSLEMYPMDDPSRVIAYMYSWQQAKMQAIFHSFGLRGPVGADIEFYAIGVTYEKEGSGPPFTVEHDWSPAPPMPGRLVPKPNSIHRQFGGDPITIKIDEKVYQRRLFIGGLDIQPGHRPQVNAVLNLGENPSAWAGSKQLLSSDRWDNKGEGADGMSAEIIRQEAEWVIERLRKDQRILVHCAAGMNRSTTICCAVLILLEGLSAEEALGRVREHHPWARPDSHHWLMLRWLEMKQREK